MNKRVIPPAIAGLGAAALLYWVWRARPLWVDEEMLLLNVRDRGFGQLPGALWLDQSAPLAWLALERAALLVLGTSERALRLLPALFGIATLATAVWIGRRWMSTLGAAIFVSMCAFGEWIVFFTLELKHYSADAFGALLVPALAVGALDDADCGETTRRVATWWTAAAVALWFSNGAVFVAPGCALVIAAVCWRRGGWPLLARCMGASLVWLASFAACYAVVLRHAAANEYLRRYWAFAYPPLSEGAYASWIWLLHQFQPFAVKPAGSGLWLLFWIAYAAGIGFSIATRRRVGIVFALTPLTALALAALHILPTFERLALWTVPSLYVGVGLCGDAAAALIVSRARLPAIRVASRGAAALAGAAAVLVSGDVVYRGVLALAHKPQSNYGLDDRSSMRTLFSMHRPGDVVLTTHFGLAALWWYGRIDISDAEHATRLADGSPVYELQYAEPGPECSRADAELAAALAANRRALVYLGFRLNVLPVGFDALALRELNARGPLVGYKTYAEESRLAAFDLTPVVSGFSRTFGDESNRDDSPPLQGCLSAVRAGRW